jgi:hypothetical protein
MKRAQKTIDEIVVGGIGRIEIAIHYWNKHGKKKIRTTEFYPVSGIKILPDNRLIIYPIGWKEDE